MERKISGFRCDVREISALADCTQRRIIIYVGVDCVQKNGTFLGCLCNFYEFKGTIQQIYPVKSGTKWVTSNGISSTTRLLFKKSMHLLFRRLKKFLLKKGFRKAHSISRFPSRLQAQDVDFCSEVLDSSSVLTSYLTVWRKECTFSSMKFNSYSL